MGCPSNSAGHASTSTLLAIQRDPVPADQTRRTSRGSVSAPHRRSRHLTSPILTSPQEAIGVRVQVPAETASTWIAKIDGPPTGNQASGFGVAR